MITVVMFFEVSCSIFLAHLNLCKTNWTHHVCRKVWESILLLNPLNFQFLVDLCINFKFDEKFILLYISRGCSTLHDINSVCDYDPKQSAWYGSQKNWEITFILASNGCYAIPPPFRGWREGHRNRWPDTLSCTYGMKSLQQTVIIFVKGVVIE